jgi:hypothetical protein
VAIDPIHQLQAQIDEALELPTAQPYAPSDEPMARLLRLIDDARNGREPVDPHAAQNTNTRPEPPEAAAAPAPAGAPGSLDALVGQSVLAMLEARDLAGSARAEAVRRLALAMQNPTAQNLQSVLDVLLTGDPQVGQTR